MPQFKNTLLISALAVSLVACSTNTETPNGTTSTTESPVVSTASSPSPQTTASPNSATPPNAANQQFTQEIQVIEPLKSGKAGETAEIPVTVKNTSNFVWDSAAANPVNFSYNWLDSKGNRVVHDGERTVLATKLSPQDSEKLNATIKFPDQPGEYTLTLTMVQEGVAWFNDVGAQAPKIPITVTAQ